MRWQIVVLNLLELAACVTGFLYWSKIRNSFWKWFPVYLAAVFIAEVTGEYFLYGRKDLGTNIIIYSYWAIPQQFLFFFWMFWVRSRGSKTSVWPVVAVVVYGVSLVIDLLYMGKMKFYFESFSYTIGCLFLLILLLLIFFDFVRTNEIINYRTSLLFWVCAGMFLFYVGTMPFFAFRNRLYENHKELFYAYWYIQFALNYLMYTFFIIGFIWGKPK